MCLLDIDATNEMTLQCDLAQKDRDELFRIASVACVDIPNRCLSLRLYTKDLKEPS